MPLSLFKAWRERRAASAASASRASRASSARTGASRGRNAPPADELDLQSARTAARRRLIGALVLLGAGVVAFPLVFETEPRPLASDTAIVVAPGAVSGTVGVESTAPPLPRPSATDPGPVVAADRSGVEETAVTPVTPVQPRPDSSPAPLPAPLPAPAPVAVPAPETVLAAPAVVPPAAPSVATPVATRVAPAVAKPPAATVAAPAATPAPPPALATDATAGRFVVQVGAYTEARALRDARQKTERLGLKTYTQVIKTAAGERTRVRVGPFATRAEAEAAGARLRAAGLPAAILTL